MGSLRDRMLARAGIDAATYTPTAASATSFSIRGVQRTAEFDRIARLERRRLDLDSVPDLTPVFRKPGGTMSLWPIQSAALLDIERTGGLLAPIGVGHGKTLISLLAAAALESRRPVLLVPPQLRAQLEGTMLPVLRQHFELPKLEIMSYSLLSTERGLGMLERLGPDLIVADEAHNLKRPQSTRTKRFLAYMHEHPECALVALSGTITQRSIRDYAHLSELALRKGSPLPHHFRELLEWSEAVDSPRPGEEVRPPGALELLCVPGEDVRAGFRRRLVETPGVVATGEGALGTSLEISRLMIHVDARIEDALARLRRTWEWDGEELADGMSLARVARTLALGFFYRWMWPNGEPDHDWLAARSLWHKELREFLKRPPPRIDSPMLVARACEAGRVHLDSWPLWRTMKDRPAPPVDAVWITEQIIRDTIRVAAHTGAATIIWYEHRAVGEKLSELGVPTFGAGSDQQLAEYCKRRILADNVIACSIKAHSIGKNLQAWSNNIVIGAPASGAAWEQLLGRTHRPGQEADEVTCAVYAGDQCYEHAVKQARADARYIEDSTGQRQKLNAATFDGFGFFAGM